MIGYESVPLAVALMVLSCVALANRGALTRTISDLAQSSRGARPRTQSVEQVVVRVSVVALLLGGVLAALITVHVIVG